jgi:signal transduction histidine kinase
MLALGAIVGAAAVAATALHLGRSPPDTWAVIRSVVIALYVIVGTYTWWRRPSSRLGPFLTAVGVFSAVAGMNASEAAVPHTVGRAALAVLVVCLAYVLLCYPHDTLHSRRERRFVTYFAVVSAILWLFALLLVRQLPPGGPLFDCGEGCPDNAFRVVTAPSALSSGISAAITGTTAAALFVLLVLLSGKARSAARLRRRMVVPVLCSVVLAALVYSAYTLLRQVGVGGTGELSVVGATTTLAIPGAMLVAQVRGRALAVTSLWRLVSRIGGGPVTPVRVEALLRDALGDPTLTLALRRPAHAGYVDVRDRPIELPAGRRDIAVTRVRRQGRTVAAVIHDAALDETSGVAERLGATALMLLENAQLVDELQASRARIVASAQRERLGLERSLHDGAQQQLFVIQLKLHAAQAQAADDGLARELQEITDDAAMAVEGLRQLADGLYPTVLRERGLPDGLRSHAHAAPVPVTLVVHDVPRCSPAVEEAVYFCVLEAVQNTVQHAGPGARVLVTVERRGDGLAFSVVDDGIGFLPDEQPERLGLLSMRDHIGAVGGELELESAPGRGTTVRGRVPGCWRADPADADAR